VTTTHASAFRDEKAYTVIEVARDLPGLTRGPVQESQFDGLASTDGSATDSRAMSAWSVILAIIVSAVGLMIIMKLFYSRTGRTENTSNRLMQLRVLIQALIVGVILIVLWLMGGGRPT
jgi:heme/copper-type cytochrome/quinol oxidase subunit 2